MLDEPALPSASSGMYKIVGGDGREYGPISAEQLRQWITQGRAHATTQARFEGSNEWKPLSAFPEFSAVLGVSGGPPPFAPGQGIPVASQKTSGLAITSLVLGLLGVFTCGLTALFGLVFGIVAQVKINKSQGRLSGSGLAIGGICASAVSLVLCLLILPGLLLPALSRAKEKAMAINCLTNMKQLGTAVSAYARDHNNQLPPAATWSDSVSNYVSYTNIFHCLADSHTGCSYAFNQKLDGQNLRQINPRTVLLFESNTGWNATGGPEMMEANRHGRSGCNVVFADGSVRIVRNTQLDTLRWDP